MSKDDQGRELAEMMAGVGIGTEPPGTEEPSTEPPEDEELETEAPETEPPEEEEEEEELATEAPSTEAPPEETPEQLRIAALLKALDEKDKLLQAQGASTAKPDGESKKEEPEKPKLPKTTEELMQAIEQLELLSDDELDRVIDDPSILNKKMKGVLTKMLEIVADAAQSSATQVMTGIPAQLGQMIREENVFQTAARAFVESNKDLAKYGSYVKSTYNTVYEEFKGQEGKTVQDVFDETERRVRADLSVPRPKGKKAKPKGLPGVKGAKKRGKAKTPKRTDQQREMDDLLEDF